MLSLFLLLTQNGVPVKIQKLLPVRKYKNYLQLESTKSACSTEIKNECSWKIQKMLAVGKCKN